MERKTRVLLRFVDLTGADCDKVLARKMHWMCHFAGNISRVLSVLGAMIPVDQDEPMLDQVAVLLYDFVDEDSLDKIQTDDNDVMDGLMSVLVVCPNHKWHGPLDMKNNPEAVIQRIWDLGQRWEMRLNEMTCFMEQIVGLGMEKASFIESKKFWFHVFNSDTAGLGGTGMDLKTKRDDLSYVQVCRQCFVISFIFFFIETDVGKKSQPS